MSADDAATATRSPVSPGSPSHFDMRNDRSQRLWGSDGQKRLAEAHAVLLGATAAGCEALKNMVLPGLGRFTIVDNGKVTDADIGRNFFVSMNAVGGFVAEEACRHIKELNPFAEGHFVTDKGLPEFVHAGGDGFLYGDAPEELASTPDPQAAAREQKKFHRPPWNATIVIATPKVPLPVLLQLSQAMATRNVPVFYLGCNGQLAYMRIMSPDMPVVDTVPGPDEQYFDPRICNPFPALKEIYEALDPRSKDLDDETFRHLPYPAILYHAIQQWRADNGKAPDAVPEPKERMAIRNLVTQWKELRGKDAHGQTPAVFDEARTNFYRAFVFQNVPTEVRRLMEEAPNRVSLHSNAFWVFMAAIKSFYEEKGYLPLSPSLPDFETTTQIYTSLAKAFKAHHHDVEVPDIYDRAVKLLKAKGASDRHIADNIHKEAAANICANITFCNYVHYPSLEDEVGASFDRPFAFPAEGSDAVAGADADHMRWTAKTNEGDAEDGLDSAVGWYTALRAMWRYQVLHKRLYPAGHASNVQNIGNDAAAEKAEMVDVATKLFAATSATDAAKTMPENVKKQVEEVVRYGGAEMGHIAAILGAVASQELIKFVQHKRMPVSSWTIYDGNTSRFIQIDPKKN